jgi:DNA-binding CsgD family transcriptional regulator
MHARLVGRDAELAALEAALTEAGRGRGRIVPLAGEAGIGKSRLAGELIDRAARTGVTTLEGRAHPLHAGLAYAPIVEAIRAYLGELPADRSARLLGGLTDLGRLLADPRLPDAPPLGDAALERTRMFEAVALLFGRIAETAPALLVVEDLHWADRGTVELLAYLGRTAERQRLLALATYSAGESDGPLRDLAVAVRRADPDAELTLLPLPDPAVTELARELLGGDPPANLLRTVAGRARGIPLFVTALVAGGDAPDPRLLPAIVRDVVLDRLRRLEDDDRRLLEIVAVAGEAGSAEVLRDVFTAPEFDHTLRRLVADGLVTEHVTGRSETYRVTHPLYAEVAYAELTVGERRTLHAAVAAAVDRIDPDDVLALAPHYREAGTLVDAARAAEVMAAAGWRALVESERGDPSRVLELPTDGTVSGDAEQMLIRTIFQLRHRDDDAVRAAATELAGFAGVDPGLAAQAAGHLGRELIAMLDNDFGTALAAASVAAEHGERCRETAPMLGTWANRELVGLTVLAGDILAARTRLRRFFDLFGPGVTPVTVCNARYSLGLLHYLAGDLDSALDDVDAGVALASRVALPRALGRTLGCRAFLLAEAGRSTEAAACLADARRAHTADEVSLVALEELVETVLAVQASRPSEVPPLTDAALYEEAVIMLLRINAAGEAAVAAGDGAEIIERLRDLGRTAPFVAVLSDRLDGLRTKDSGLLREAADRLDGMGAPALGAQARLEWAEHSVADPAARDAVSRCLEVFGKAGMTGRLDRTRKLARTLGVRVPMARKSGELSKREAQIVGLVGAGLSNADIAVRLFLSERTVETHLRNAYARLGIGSRVALARWAAEHLA